MVSLACICAMNCMIRKEKATHSTRSESL